MNQEKTESFGEFFSRKAEMQRIPFTGTFELSPVCNLDCQMCYVRKSMDEVKNSGGLLDVNFWTHLIEEAVKEGMLFCLITGGEPFIYPNFRTLCERISQLPIYFSINTNAVLLNEETIKWLKNIHTRQINISLYGASSETYQKLCGNPDAFYKVLNAMELLNRYQIHYEVHTTLTPNNIDDYDKIIEICDSFRTKLQMTYYMFPPYRKGAQHIGTNAGRFTPQRAAEVAHRYRHNQHASEEEYEKYIIEQYNILETPEQFPFYGDCSMRCKAGINTFWVDWQGMASACGVMNQGKVDLKVTPFAEGWEQIKQMRDSFTISEKCQYCDKQKLCPVCAAAAYCETGAINGTPEYCCKFSEEYERLIRQEWKRLQNEKVR